MNQLANHHRLLAAPVHTIETHWRLRSNRVAIGPTQRIVLHLEAKRDVELCLTTVRVFGLAPGAEWNWILAQVPAVHGVRRYKPEGERWVIGRQDLPGQVGMSLLPVGDMIQAPEDVAKHAFMYSGNPSRVTVPKSICIGVLVSATMPCECSVELGGV